MIFLSYDNVFFFLIEIYSLDTKPLILAGWERSGSVVECLTRDRGATGSSLTGVTGLCP